MPKAVIFGVNGILIGVVQKTAFLGYTRRAETAGL